MAYTVVVKVSAFNYPTLAYPFPFPDLHNMSTEKCPQNVTTFKSITWSLEIYLIYLIDILIQLHRPATQWQAFSGQELLQQQQGTQLIIIIKILPTVCNYPSFHFTCLLPDKFVSWPCRPTSQWTINLGWDTKLQLNWTS